MPRNNVIAKEKKCRYCYHVTRDHHATSALNVVIDIAKRGLVGLAWQDTWQALDMGFGF